MEKIVTAVLVAHSLKIKLASTLSYGIMI